MRAQKQHGGRHPPLILASTSPRRAELLARMGEKFRVVKSDTPEINHTQLTGRELAQVNAYRKARQVAKHHTDDLVLGADTVVCVDALLLGKPADQEEAQRMLAQLQGRTHQVITAVCLLHLRSHRQRIFSVVTDVTFKPLATTDIQLYTSRVNTLDKAGAYAIQEQGDLIIERINGSPTNVIGLPVERLETELRNWPSED